MGANPAVGTDERPLAELAPEFRERLAQFGAPLLLTEIESRLALAERKISAFEQKYGATFVALCGSGIPDDASLDMHEDFIEWAGWQRTREEALHARAALERFLESRLAPAPSS